MKNDFQLQKYLNRYGAVSPWILETKTTQDVEQVVVVPAFAEKNHLFATLGSLAENDEKSIKKTLVICVVNHKASALTEDKQNNADTLEILRALIEKRSLPSLGMSSERRSDLELIADSPLRMGLIDACSPGREILPHVGGVGMARKIGMDRALSLLGNGEKPHRFILSLDADTLVKKNYLAAVRQALSNRRIKTGVVAYEHQLPADEKERHAIVCYEIFLRYWELGLKFAGSPYAFHSIGSTIVTTSDAYLTVRGMNRRDAGEDFYFLNKLAKVGPVKKISETTVYPSARVSRRVPFGTGASIGKIVSGSYEEGYPLYNPLVFDILKKWIEVMRNSFGVDAEEVIDSVQDIDEALKDFLISRGFFNIWKKIQKNVRNEKVFEKQIFDWFDGFESLKLINFLTQRRYSKIRMSDAVDTLLKMIDSEGDPSTESWNPTTILQLMRKRTA